MVALKPESTEARDGLNAGHGDALAVGFVEGDGGGDVDVGDAIAIRPIMNLGLSFDHRINDGLQATRFVTAVQKLLEGIDPSGTLV